MYPFLACLMVSIAATTWMHLCIYKRNFEKRLRLLPNTCKQTIIKSITNEKATTVGGLVVITKKEHTFTIAKEEKKERKKDALDNSFGSTNIAATPLISALSSKKNMHAVIFKNRRTVSSTSDIAMAIGNIKKKPLTYQYADFKVPFNAPFTDLHFVGDKTLFCICNNRLYRFNNNKEDITYHLIMDKDPITGMVAPLNIVSIAFDPDLPIAFILKNKKRFIYELCAVNLCTRKYKNIETITSARFAEHFKPYRITYDKGLLVVHFKDMMMLSNVQILTIPATLYKI